jgi:asparagine synthase (glutamine-hydrolysing)
MSGLFGCWHRDGRPVDGVLLAQCLSHISPRGHQDTHVFTRQAVGLGHKSHGGGSPTSDGARVTCIFDGRLDNRDELARIVDGTSQSGNCSDSGLVLRAYERYADDFIAHVHGDFALALFDHSRDRLILARDRLGLRPLCYTETNNTVLFASEAKALLGYPGVRSSPDETMLADFVLRFVANDSDRRTFFDGIHSVPPAHLLIATAGRLELRRYFDFETERRVRFAAVDDYAAAFRELFVRAVRKRLRCARPVAISVSGGLDSAFIFCVAQELARAGHAPCPAVIGFNYAGTSGTRSDERSFVEAIERQSGAAIRRIPQRAGFMESAGDEVWHCESPLLDALSRQRQALLGRARDAGVGSLLTGHWGDQVLSDADYLVDLVRSGSVRLLKRHAGAWGITHRRLAFKVARDLSSRHLPSPFLAAARRWRAVASRRESSPDRDAGGSAWQAPWYTASFRHLLRNRFDERRPRRRRGTSHAWAIYQQSRRTYHVQCMEWNTRMAAMHGIDTAFPYLDCDLLQFLMAIPGDIQSCNGIPRGLMRRAMRGIVPDIVIDRRTKGEFTQLANQSIEYDFSEIAGLLGPAAVSVRLGYLDGPELWKRIEGWRTSIGTSDDAVLSNRLIDLCGFELLLRSFFSGEIESRSILLQASASP